MCSGYSIGLSSSRFVRTASCWNKGRSRAPTRNCRHRLHAVTNPRWENFKSLFRYVDQGSADGEFRGYNGGLFQESPVDNLAARRRTWTQFFHYVGEFDFADEVNLEVLGHLFERSITELEKLKASGLFGGSAARAARNTR